jgi:hypothetical protein
MAVVMKQQLQEDMTATCHDNAFLVCIGINQKKCISAVSGAMSACDHLFPKSDADLVNETALLAHGECIESRLLKNAGVSAEKLDACDQMAGGEAVVSESPMDIEQAATLMNQALQQHAQSVGTTGVTLPIYKNATIMSHFADGEVVQMLGLKALPAMMLVSADDTDKIAAYYRNKLKGFKEYKKNEDILFLEKGPKNFDYVKDMKTYITTPHVMIMPMHDVPGMPAGSKTKIEISYKK